MDGLISCILGRRMALRTLNLSSRRLKKRLWCSRWSDVSRCRKAMWTNFLHPVHRKKRLGWSRLSDALSRRMAPRINNLSSRSFIKRLWWSRWNDFSRCRKVVQINFLHPGNRKNRFGRSRLSDVLSRRMTLRPHNLPFEVLKNDFVAFDEVTFKGVKGHANTFSASWASKKATWTKSLKCCLK
jgi:hypothetical protein